MAAIVACDDNRVRYSKNMLYTAIIIFGVTILKASIGSYATLTDALVWFVMFWLYGIALWCVMDLLTGRKP